MEGEISWPLNAVFDKEVDSSKILCLKLGVKKKLIKKKLYNVYENIGKNEKVSLLKNIEEWW